jgi:hypothetical protein
MSPKQHIAENYRQPQETISTPESILDLHRIAFEKLATICYILAKFDHSRYYNPKEDKWVGKNMIGIGHNYLVGSGISENTIIKLQNYSQSLNTSERAMKDILKYKSVIINILNNQRLNAPFDSYRDSDNPRLTSDYNRERFVKLAKKDEDLLKICTQILDGTFTISDLKYTESGSPLEFDTWVSEQKASPLPELDQVLFCRFREKYVKFIDKIDKYVESLPQEQKTAPLKKIRSMLGF